MPTGKEIHLRCYTCPKDTTLVFERFFEIGQSAHLFKRNVLIFRTLVMTLHSEAKLRISIYFCPRINYFQKLPQKVILVKYVMFKNLLSNIRTILLENIIKELAILLKKWTTSLVLSKNVPLPDRKRLCLRPSFLKF